MSNGDDPRLPGHEDVKAALEQGSSELGEMSGFDAQVHLFLTMLQAAGAHLHRLIRPPGTDVPPPPPPRSVPRAAPQPAPPQDGNPNEESG